jgi:phosphodiesterase/alkaline phosphatase D-like protein
VTALLERRRFLRAASLAGVGAPLVATVRFGAAPAGAGPSDGPAAFTHGVASGDPGPEGVVLWTRVSPVAARPLEVGWRIATDPRLVDVVADGTAVAAPARDGIVQVEVGGLRPGTTYWFGFTLDGLASPTGRTRTLPGPRASSARVAVLSCGNLETGWFNAYARVAERDDLDLVVHLGDYVYEYGDVPEAATPLPGRAHHPRVELRALPEYRQRYAQYRADADLQHLHSRHPVVSLFDDHEIANDCWATGAEAHDPREDGGFAARRDAALTAWREWHPRRAGSPEVWRGLPLGRLLDLSLVDGRSHRPHLGSPAVPGHPDDALGADQRAWLAARLAQPASRWPVVMTQQPVARRLDGDGQPAGRAGWNGFPAAQQALLDAVRTAGALVVSGDVHSSWELDLGGATEVVVPSVSSRSVADRDGVDAALAEARALRAVDRSIRWLDLQHHGYVVLDAHRDRLRVEWWWVDGIEDRRAGQRLAHAIELPA